MVIVVMGGQYRVNGCNSKRVVDDGRSPEIRLCHTAAGHIPHLMKRVHLLRFLRPFSIAKPQIDGNIRFIFCFDPESGTADPPHRKGSRLYLLLVDLFIQPCPPFRKRA